MSQSSLQTANTIGSIFIRQQLPKQSTSFEAIDKAMNVFITRQQENLNAIHHFLEWQQRELTVIEKSLQEYLEMKRRAFPRFCFVSANDLLDILSNDLRRAALRKGVRQLDEGVEMAI
jgi:dynein heavy chain